MTNTIPRKFYRLIATASDGSTLEIYQVGDNGYLTRDTHTGEYNYVTADAVNRMCIQRIDY